MTHPIDQIARLNDWLAEHEPDLYWGSLDRDTADVVIDLLNQVAAKATAWDRTVEETE